MKKTEFILNKLYTLHHVGIRVMNSNGSMIGKPFVAFENSDPVYCNPSLYHLLCSKYLSSTATCLLQEDQGFLYTIFKYMDHFIILGPVSMEDNVQHEARTYLSKNSVLNKTLQVPYMNIKQLKELTTLVYGIVTEEYDNVDTLFENERENKAVENTIHKELTEYLLHKSEHEQAHFTYQDEKRYAEYIIRGEYDKLYAGMNELSDIYTEESIGTMSETKLKQSEYKSVAWITLMTRYAIMAGVSDTTSYGLSDISLQMLSKARNLLEIENTMDSCNKEFERLIKEAVSLKKTRSPYIEKCKSYIETHIFEKISLQEIAKEVGLHPVYLSRIFSENMGMSISSYIMQEKIKVSCNLLKYSDKSIATIAEYMNMAPQSYFTRIFKKVMNKSPGQYQKEYLDKTFYES
ncbi:MAG: AraC family transcriptional regulator [bacterium]|nr:AraC family transcriptional regulator [bacterium]